MTESWPPTVQGDPDDVISRYLAEREAARPPAGMTLAEARRFEGAIVGVRSHRAVTPELATVDAVSGAFVLGEFVGDGQPFAVSPEHIVEIGA